MTSILPILAQTVEGSEKFLKGVTSETPEGGGGTFWMPFRASTYAGEVDWTFYFIYWICVVFTIGIFVAMTWFVIKYRHKAGQHAPAHKAGHSTTLELTWTVVPTILVLMIFYYGFRSYLSMSVIPPDAYEINVTARMWSWAFTYPDGHVDAELHIPAGVPVRLVLTSEDVIHSLYVPAFRAKKDAVPGRYNKMWFQSNIPGKYQVFCTEYCGTHHSNMGAVLVVHPLKDDGTGVETWAAWEERSRDPRRVDPNPVIVGQKLYAARGCNQCHSVDGTANRGPTWKDLFGNQRQFRDGGSALADENYIVESINQPNAHIVQGFDGIMPSYQGSFKQDELTALIAYMKSISTQAPKPPTTWDEVDGKPASPGDENTGRAPVSGASPNVPGGQQPVAPATPTTPQGENMQPQTQPPANRTAEPAPGQEQKQDPITPPAPQN